MLGHDLEMPSAKFQGNRFGIDGEIDEKHALQIIVSFIFLSLRKSTNYSLTRPYNITLYPGPHSTSSACLLLISPSIINRFS